MKLANEGGGFFVMFYSPSYHIPCLKKLFYCSRYLLIVLRLHLAGWHRTVGQSEECLYRELFPLLSHDDGVIRKR